MHKRTRPCLGTGHDDGDNGQEYVRSLRSLPYPTTQALSALMGGRKKATCACCHNSVEKLLLYM